MGARSSRNTTQNNRSDGHLLEYFRKSFVRGGGANAGPNSPEGITATGGVISDYTVGPTVYRAHIFTSSGTFSVSSIGSFGSNVEYLVVAGGGGGGSVNASPGYAAAGGGGAGGFKTNVPGYPAAGSAFPVSTSPGSYAVTIGAGGVGGDGSITLSASNGVDSSFGPIISTGGGEGSCTTTNPLTDSSHFGVPGGSGGAASGRGAPTSGGDGAGFPGPTQQGFPGAPNPSNSGGAGGGGGAGAAGRLRGDWPGGPSPAGFGGSGGDGFSTNISGITTHYAGGGGGGSYTDSATVPLGIPGGLGGGGNGGPTSSPFAGYTGTYATGGGGGGGTGGTPVSSSRGGNGGSGIVVVRYQIGTIQTGTAKATGGVISYYGGKTIHTFTSTGTFATAPNWTAATVEYLVVGGGGGGGGTLSGGGGGAGGYITGTTPIGAHPVSTSIQVGAGGVGGVGRSPGGFPGSDGTPSYFGTPLTAYGGGGGGSSPPVGAAGRAGGSGGGGSADRPATPNPGPSPYTPQQGFPGGSGGQGTWGAAGGGGGAGGAGADGGGPAPSPLSPVPGESLYYNGAALGYGGLGRQVPATFRNPASRIGAPGPTGPVPATNPGGDTSGLYWLAGGGGGASTDIRPTAAGGGITVYTGSGYSYTATPYAGAGNGSPTETVPALQNTGSGGGGSDRWAYSGSPNYYFPGGSGGSGIVLIAYPS